MFTSCQLGACLEGSSANLWSTGIHQNLPRAKRSITREQTDLSILDTDQFTNSTDPNFPCSVHLCHFMSPKHHIQPASSYIRHSLHLALELGSQLIGLLQIGQLHALLLPWPKPPPPWQTQLQLATGPHGRHGTCCIEWRSCQPSSASPGPSAGRWKKIWPGSVGTGHLLGKIWYKQQTEGFHGDLTL